MSNEFGNLFKDLRVRLGLTLRKYCEKYDQDPALISRLERGLAGAPKVKEKIKFYAETLALTEGSDEWNKFFDFAAVSNRTFGTEEIKSEALLKKLPVFLRTLDNKNLDAEKLEKLLEMIRKS